MSVSQTNSTSDSGYKKFAIDIGTIGIAEVILYIRGLIFLPLIAKLFGPGGYGVWAQVLATLSIAGTIVGMGLSTSMVRFLAADEDKNKIREGFFSVLLAVLMSGFVATVILFSLSGVVSGTFFGGIEAIQVVRLTSLLIPVSAANTACLSFFVTFRQMKIYSVLNLSQNLGETVFVIISILLGFGIPGAVLSLLIVRVLVTVVSLFFILRRIGIARPKFSILKAYLKFGLPLIPTDFFAWVVELSDRYLIGYFLGVTSVGIYSAAYGLGVLVGYFRTPIVQVLPPALSKLYDQQQIADVRNYLVYSLKYFLMLAIPAFFGLSFLGDKILRSLTTASFSSSGYIVIPFAAMGMLLYGTYALTGGQILRLDKRTNILAYIWGISAIVKLGLNLILVPRFGILAAAITTLVAYALATGLTLYFAAQVLVFKVPWPFILKSLAASLVMSLFLFWLKPIGAWNIFLVVLSGVVMYGAMLFLLRGFEKKEITFFVQILKSTCQSFIHRFRK